MAEDVPRSGIPLVDALLLALGIGLDLGLAARPVKVQIRIELIPVEVVNGVGMLGLDVKIAHVLADHGPVFGFHQGVVVGVPWRASW